MQRVRERECRARIQEFGFRFRLRLLVMPLCRQQTLRLFSCEKKYRKQKINRRKVPGLRMVRSQLVLLVGQPLVSGFWLPCQVAVAVAVAFKMPLAVASSNSRNVRQLLFVVVPSGQFTDQQTNETHPMNSGSLMFETNISLQFTRLEFVAINAGTNQQTD